jgi:hypothetical protein
MFDCGLKLLQPESNIPETEEKFIILKGKIQIETEQYERIS